MSIAALIMNLMLAALLMAALVVGVRLNKRLKVLRESHEGFAAAVHELNAAAARAEQGLADLRAATDEATDQLADRIEKGRALAARLERLTTDAPAAAAGRATPARAAAPAEPAQRDGDRLGALLAAAREARAEPPRRVRAEPPRRAPADDDDLFQDPPSVIKPSFGARR